MGHFAKGPWAPEAAARQSPKAAQAATLGSSRLAMVLSMGKLTAFIPWIMDKRASMICIYIYINTH